MLLGPIYFYLISQILPVYMKFTNLYYCIGGPHFINFWPFLANRFGLLAIYFPRFPQIASIPVAVFTPPKHAISDWLPVTNVEHFFFFWHSGFRVEKGCSVKNQAPRVSAYLFFLAFQLVCATFGLHSGSTSSSYSAISRSDPGSAHG